MSTWDSSDETDEQDVMERGYDTPDVMYERSSDVELEDSEASDEEMDETP